MSTTTLLQRVRNRFQRPAPAAQPGPDSGPRPGVFTPTLVDPVLDETLRVHGFVVVDLLESDELATLLARFHELHPAPTTTTWESDFYTGDTGMKRTVHRTIGDAFAPGIGRHFRGHHSVLHNFVINWPGPDGGLVLHQHSSVVDPALGSSVVVWCALNDASEANGTLHVVPASHTVQLGPRPERTSSWHEPFTEQLLEEFLVRVEVPAGHALVFDNQLLHCSFPNTTDEPRITAAAVVVPDALEPLFYERLDDTTARAYRLDPEFFLTHAPGDLEWATPEGLEVVGDVPWAPVDVTAAQVERMRPDTACPHGTATRADETAPGPVHAPSLPDAVDVVLPDRTPATLRDPGQQAHLEQFGFAVLDALDADLLGQVRAVYAELGAAPDDPQRALNWTFHSQSAEHKHAVKDRLLAVVGPRLDELFADQTPYLTSFITKWPGPDSGFAPHQDPTLVDERSFTGVTIWIPLHDTGPVDGHDNGMLQFVPGSHRFATTVRVADVDDYPFSGHETAIVERHGVAVPTTAGEALVFDNRAIHFSMPNTTNEPRVVLAFGMRPRSSAAVLGRRTPAGDAALYELPEDFFIDVLPAAQHEWVPTAPPIVVARRTEERWTAEEFDQMCAAVPRPPRGLAADEHGANQWVDPGSFCALCGNEVEIDAEDRARRNNAQLVCPDCRERIRS
jgi:ectoine hydroxylase-related dioxygenase (phytanoyl-CoA dioxygenase family)